MTAPGCLGGRLLQGFACVLTGFQDAFVALAADARLRRRFAADRDAALADFALSARERAALVALPVDELERYARALVAKRWGEVARALPLTLRVAPSVGDHCRRWLADHPAPARDSVLPPGVAEAMRALGALRARLGDDREASYAADLLAFETLRAAARADGEPRTMRSRFAIHALADQVARKLLPIDPELAPTEVRFERDGVRWRGGRR